MGDNDGTPAGHSSGRGTLAGLSVLVVDDNADQREVLALMLEFYAAEVVAAGSVPEALDLLGRLGPAVLLSDIGMPGQDGYDLIRTVRRLPPGRGGRTPAIAMTAFAAEHDRARALRAGFDAYLPKPIAWDRLVRAVAELAARR